MTQSAYPFNLGKNTICLWMIPNKYHKRDDHEGPNRSKKHDKKRIYFQAGPGLRPYLPGCKTVMAWNPGQEDSAQETSGHKFGKELPGPKMTYRRMAAAPHRSFIRFARFLEKELGNNLIGKQMIE